MRRYGFDRQSVEDIDALFLAWKGKSCPHKEYFFLKALMTVYARQGRDGYDIFDTVGVAVLKSEKVLRKCAFGKSMTTIKRYLKVLFELGVLVDSGDRLEFCRVRYHRCEVDHTVMFERWKDRQKALKAASQSGS